MGLDFDQLFPNRFLKAGEFKGKPVTLTVSAVVVEELEGDKGKQVKGIISFAQTRKQWVLNKTNGLCMRAMFGRDTGAWVGKRVTLYPAAIQFEDTDIAIRVLGSPDISAPIQFELKLARKKPRMLTMQRTGQPAAAPAPAAVAAQPTAPPSAEPPPDMVLPGQAGHPATPKRSLPIIDVIDDESEEDATARFNGLAEGDNTFP